MDGLAEFEDAELDEPHWTEVVPETGYIVVDGEPMAYWLPDGVTLDLGGEDGVPF